MTHSHHPHCWYKQYEASSFPAYDKIWTQRRVGAAVLYIAAVLHLKLLNPALNRGQFKKGGEIKRRNQSRLQHTKCSGMREANGAPCSALWWWRWETAGSCGAAASAAAAASINPGNAVSINGPGILMPQCRGAGAAVWQGPRETLRFTVLYTSTESFISHSKNHIYIYIWCQTRGWKKLLLLVISTCLHLDSLFKKCEI